MAEPKGVEAARRVGVETPGAPRSLVWRSPLSWRVEIKLDLKIPVGQVANHHYSWTAQPPFSNCIGAKGKVPLQLEKREEISMLRIYVSTVVGDDKNDGLSEQSPVRSARRANALCLGNNEIVIMGGMDMLRQLNKELKKERKEKKKEKKGKKDK